MAQFQFNEREQAVVTFDATEWRLVAQALGFACERATQPDADRMLKLRNQIEGMVTGTVDDMPQRVA